MGSSINQIIRKYILAAARPRASKWVHLLAENKNKTFTRVLTKFEESYNTVGHKNFSFCEQTLHKGLIDASCSWIQYTAKNRGQNKFLRKLRAKIRFLRLLFSSLRSIYSYNPHTTLKNARRGRLKIYIYFYLQKLQVGPGDAARRQRQYATKNMARTNFLRKI
jgi:hypothetical protein